VALETEVIESARAFSQVIHEVAAERGWTPDSYRVHMSVNRDWYILNALVVNYRESFTNQQQQDIYDDIYDKLEPRLGHVPRPFNSFGLVIRGRESRGDLDSMPLGPEDEIIDDTLLNPSPASNPPAATPSK
jgi:hypothetical protein